MRSKNMTEQSMPSTQGTAAAKAAGVSAVAGPLTIRDLAVLGSVILIFIASLIPLLDTRAGSINLWNTTNLFYMGVGMILPLATAVLFLIRRFSPGTKLRLGSLSVDQFASVVAVFSAFFYFASITTNYRAAFLVGMIGGVLFLLSTVCAPWIPVLAADFADRPEVPAHPVARDAVAPTKRPSSPKPLTGKGAASAGAAGAGGAGDSSAADGAAGGAASGDGSVSTPAAGWSGNRPTDVHTAAGQIYTPAKDTRPGAGAGAAGVAGSAAAAAGSAAGTPSAAGAGATGSAEATTGAATANPTAGSASAPGAGANSALGTAAKVGTEQPLSGAVQSSTTAAETSSFDAEDQPTTLNPQLPTPAEDQAARIHASKDSGKPAETAKSGTENATASGATAKEAEARTKGASAPARESITATVDPQAAAPAVIAEPFWFAVDRPQNVIDEKTRQFIYKLTPGSWILALEDRGNSFLVQDSHGKTGVLLDLVGIERASDSQ